MNTVIVAAMTTSIRRGSPIEVVLPAGRPLKNEGAILAFQVTTLDKARLMDFKGTLDGDQLRELDKALSLAFGLGRTR